MVSGLSTNSSALSTWQSTMKQRQQDLSALSSALQSGNLAGAQSAFSDLQSLASSRGTPASGATANAKSSAATTAAPGTTSIASDFKALGQALQSGDMGSAQSAFNQLQSAMQAQHGRMHHHHHHGGSGIASLLQALDSSSSNSVTTADDTAGDAVTNAASATSNTNSTSGTNSIASDFKALGQALQSGDMGSAQSAFDQLQNAMQAQQAEGHQHHYGGSDAIASLMQSLDPSSSSSSISTAQALSTYQQNSSQNALGELLSSISGNTASSALSLTA